MFSESTSTIIDRSPTCELAGTPANGISVKTTSKRYVLEEFILLSLVLLRTNWLQWPADWEALCVPRVALNFFVKYNLYPMETGCRPLPIVYLKRPK